MAVDMCDYSVGLILNKYLESRFKIWSKSEKVPQSLKESLNLYQSQNDLEKPLGKRTVPFSVIRKIHSYLDGDEESEHLHELLRGCEMQFSKPKVVERNPELEARIQKLKAQQENKEYNQMTKNVNLQYQATHMNEIRSEGELVKQSARNRMQKLRESIGLVNFVITVAACFLFGYKAVQYALPVPSLPLQMVAGMICAIVAGLADLYFLVKKLD